MTYPLSINEWIDRDIQRTIGLVTGTHIPLGGPEMNAGGFLPGPFFYLLLAPVYIFTRSPYAAGYLNSTLNLVSLFLFFFVIRKRYSSFCTLVSLGLLSFSMMHASSFGTPINPSFLFVFNTLIIWFFLKIFVDRKEVYWIPAVLTIALGSQVHLSMMFYLLSLIVLSLFVFRPRGQVIVFSILSALPCFIPYLTYLYLTRNVALYRSYKQFSESGSLLEFFPRDTFSKIFSSHSFGTAYERLTEIIHTFIPSLTTPINPQMLLFYIRGVIGTEVWFFLTACLVGTGMFVAWGCKSRFQFSDTERRRILPFLAILPILLVWQWGGVSRHGHHWYSFIFFPLLPLWIGVSLDAIASWIRPPVRRLFQGFVLASIVLLAPNSLMFPKSIFPYLLDDVVKDVREVKQELGFSLERYRKDVFYVDRPADDENPKNTDPPFERLPWGVYTDYLYDAVTPDMPSNEEDSEQCYLVAHRSNVDFYSLGYYLENIETHFGIRPTRIRQSDRLVFFEYSRPKDGNCFHNTINAWVANERMGLTIAKVPSNAQSTVVKDEKETDPSGQWVKRDIEFAIFDRRSLLPMVIRLSFQRNQGGILWQATLDSAQLMGHLNTMNAYSGLYRPWPKLWLEDVRLVLEADGLSETLRFASGEIGKFMFTPLTSVPTYLSQSLDGKNLELSLKYKTVVSGRYEGGGSDIQQLARHEDDIQSWDVTQVLYGGTL